MFRKTILLLLVALIALQSVVAMADAHQVHQSGIEHLDSAGPDGTSGDASADLSSTDSTGQTQPGDSILDCQHCCHCHAMAHLFVSSDQHNFSLALSGLLRSDYRESYFSTVVSENFRPPIA